MRPNGEAHLHTGVHESREVCGMRVAHARGIRDLSSVHIGEIT